MAGTAQSNAISVANQVLDLGARLLTFLDDVNAMVRVYNDTGPANNWQALATAPKAADGSLGTADGSPNTAHPIDTRVVVGLNQATSSANLMSAVGILQDFQTFMNGTGAAPQVNRRQALGQNITG